MKHFISSLSLITTLSSFSLAETKPNIVIIYGDDVGYGDVGCYGATKIPTPFIDKLASEGLRFTDGHCSSATCTPSRYSMLTGLYGFREGVAVLPPNAPICISTEDITLPKMLKKAGYNTAVVGKWHLGIGDGKTPVDWNGDVKPGPLEVGFDYSFLLPSTNDRVPCVYVENHRVVNLDPADPLYVGTAPEGHTSTSYPYGRTNPEAETYYAADEQHSESVIGGIARIGKMWGGKSALWNDETMADEFVDKASAFIAKQDSNTPFFLYFASQDIHVPRAPHPRFQGKTELGKRGDAMVQFDWTVGAVVNALEKHGFRENTIVIVSSDNGPVYDDGYDDGTTVRKSTKESDNGHDGSGIFSGGKYQIFEGGTRVPFIIRWPNNITAGSTSDALVNQIDFIASFAELTGVELADSEAIDSRNSLDAFLGKDPKGLSYTVEEALGAIALREGPWKYIPAKKTKKGTIPQSLYNLDEDKAEKINLIDSHPEQAKAMQEHLEKIIASKSLR